MKKITAFFLIPAACLLLSMTGCQKKNNGGEGLTNPETVVAQPVKKLTVNREISLSGNIEGKKTIKLGFLVSGKVNYLPLDEGSTFHQGDCIAGLDPESYRLGLDAATAGLNQVTDEYNRLQKMHAKGSLAESDFEKVSNTLKQVQAQQKLAAKNLADTKLFAPISGVILKRLSEPGEVVGSGYPVYVLADISSIKVSASVPESELRYMKLGQTAKVYIAAIDSHFVGKISEIGALADPYTRTYAVKIELPNPGLRIRPGMIAEIRIVSTALTQILSIPGDAILRDLDRTTYVYVADRQKGSAFKRKVSVGNPYENNIEITTGLTENELVVSGGQQKLTDGAPIKIK
jgi:RND family efflux transporter MFP subunit